MNIQKNARIKIMTSLEPVLPPKVWNRTLKFRCRYRGEIRGSARFASLLCDDLPAIPGLSRAHLGETVCSHTVPQAICCDQKHIYLTAYCHCRKKGYEHDSMIHILRKDNGALLGTVPIDRCHVGGIAADSENGYLFVCNSRRDTMMVYSCERLLQALSENDRKGSLRPDFSFDVGQTPSFCTFFDGIIWVGTFAKEATALAGYIRTDQNTYQKAYSLSPVPPHTQGAAFYRRGDAVSVTFSRSYGWILASRLEISRIPGYDSARSDGIAMETEPFFSLRMPGMMEGIDHDDGSLYVIFESAARQYQSKIPFMKNSRPCDRICRIEIRSLERLIERWENTV